MERPLSDVTCIAQHKGFLQDALITSGMAWGNQLMTPHQLTLFFPGSQCRYSRQTHAETPPSSSERSKIRQVSSHLA